MSTFTNEYILYLIKQYFEKPKANAEIMALLNGWSEVNDFIADFGNHFDIDQAEGVVLDVIGRIVGLPRQANGIIPIVFFGFSNNQIAKGFADKFDTTRTSAPFRNKFAATQTSLQLDDFTYRRYLKIKIAKNICSPYFASDDRVSLQQVVFDAFQGRAYAIDNKDNTLSLFVSPSVSDEEILIVLSLDLLPRPLTFSYRDVIRASSEAEFGL